MTILIYFIMFIIGITIGSFCTLAVYRIPLKKDITHERSFCPNCNHKLSFWDLIPILSYVFLGGKCRYCKKPIRIRYLVLEILSGMIAVLLVLSMNIFFNEIDISKFICLFFDTLYIIGIVIIAGIDKEKKIIESSVLIYNIVVTCTYILYLFIVETPNVNRYAMYLFFMLILILFKIYDKKAKKQRNKPIGFYICCINIIILIIQNYINYYA